MDKEKIHILNGATLYSYIIKPSYQLKRNTDKWNNDLNPAVLILPGGGYKRIEDCENSPVVFSFLNAGYSCFVLEYSCNDDSKYPNPILEGFESLKYIRKNANNFKIDSNKIICCGFSAGGHLASLLGCKNIAECLGYNYESVKLNATILGYPFIDMKTYYENHPNKFGKFGLMVSDMDIIDCINPTLYVDGNYPPAFIWNTQEDDLVDCEQSIEFVKKIVEVKGIVEYHMFTYGVHGLSLNNILTNKGNILNNHMKSPNVSKWFEMAIEWLNRVLEVK